METQNRNQILSYILNKIDKGNAQYTDHEAAQKCRFSSSKKNLKTHSAGHEKQYREAMKFAKFKTIDKGTVNKRQTATTMKFIDQFNNCRTHNN